MPGLIAAWSFTELTCIPVLVVSSLEDQSLPDKIMSSGKFKSLRSLRDRQIIILQEHPGRGLRTGPAHDLGLHRSESRPGRDRRQPGGLPLVRLRGGALGKAECKEGP